MARGARSPPQPGRRSRQLRVPRAFHVARFSFQLPALLFQGAAICSTPRRFRSTAAFHGTSNRPLQRPVKAPPVRQFARHINGLRAVRGSRRHRLPPSAGRPGTENSPPPGSGEKKRRRGRERRYRRRDSRFACHSYFVSYNCGNVKMTRASSSPGGPEGPEGEILGRLLAGAPASVARSPPPPLRGTPHFSATMSPNMLTRWGRNQSTVRHMRALKGEGRPLRPHGPRHTPTGRR